MNRRSVLAIATTVTLAGAAFTATAAERAQLDGSGLFTYHGCVNCHGAQGKNPKSKLVPKLAGKPADKLLTKVTKILAGEDLTDESMLMHSAIAYSQACDAPPSEAELRAITTWLSSQ
jgi:cytochrome c553